MASLFPKILVPLDLSDKNAGAMALVRDLALQDRSSVILLHVIETLDVPFEELQDFYERLEEAARHRMADLARPLAEAEIGVEQIVRYGKRAPEIVAYAQESGADLIVIGSHRPDPERPEKTLLTISHQVAIFAPCPVLVVK